MLPRVRIRWAQVLDNLGTLLMAVILALVVWLVAVDQENPYERRVFPTPIPLVVRGLTEELLPLQDLSRSTTTLTVRAPKLTWETLGANDFIVYIDFTGMEPGPHEVPVQWITQNPDVEVVDLQPSRLRVQLEPVITKAVPVQVTIMDTPAVGYDEMTPTVTPLTVTVKGPALLVNQVTFAAAEVYLLDAKSRVEVEQSATPRNSQNQPIDRVAVDPTKVRVVVPVVQREGRRGVAVLVEPQGQPANGYSISNVQVDPPTVVLLGSPETLRSVAGYVEATPFSVAGATEDVRERLALKLPENVTAEVDSVTVTVTITPVEGKRTVKRQPVIQGLDDGLTASVSLETIDVFLSGPLPRLEALGPDDVRIILNLSGLAPGSHVVDPTIIAPEGIQVEGKLPQVVEVVVSQLPTPTPETTPAPTPGG